MEINRETELEVRTSVLRELDEFVV